MSIVWIVLLFGIMWFLLIRPQQTQQKRRQQMIAAIKRGDRVVTAGGIVGTITDVREDGFLVRIADRVEVEVKRSGIGYVLPEGEKKAEKEAEK
ncbi:MAG TPA: preprotein translocase subunit YajC [Firmicutes bacterium]|nr:preprotein translocase subunit YajC [Bacillota bacterium]